jgi:hypothetical protein
MTFRRVAAVAAMLGAIGWLLLFGPGTMGVPVAGIQNAMWAFPLAFGLGTIALYGEGSRRRDGAISWAAGAVGVVSAGSLMAGSLVVTGGAGGYAAWLGFVGGVALGIGLWTLPATRSAGPERVSHEA